MVLILLLSGFFYCLSLNANVLININTAGQEELNVLPGIGPAKARAIIDYREMNGCFFAIEDIMIVSGIGEVTYGNIRDLITVDEIISAEFEADAEEYAGEAVEGLEENEIDLSAGYKQEELNMSESESFDYKSGDIVINEFVSDPADGEVEWIELFCNLGEKTDLTDWHIQEGSGAKTNLAGEINDFFIIEKPKGNLNNKGDIIELYYENILIDQVIYGDWDGAGNAPAACDPFSVARKIDGHVTLNNKNDFSATTKPTKNFSNIIINENETEEAGAETDAAPGKSHDYGVKILISEILPNPKGSDTEKEFIEVYNAGSKDVDLAGWRLGDESRKRHKIKAGSIIKAGEYFVIYRRENKIALNNTGDTVKLFNPFEDEPIVKLIYANAKENQSYNLNPETGEYAWNRQLSPGKKNSIDKINYPPIVDFDCPARTALASPVIFDSSDTIDEDGEVLEYFWDFGDGFTNVLASPEHTFFKAGAYAVKLTVRDSKNKAVKEKIIIAGELADEEINNLTNDFEPEIDVVISEIMPAPLGADSEEEFIEIYNRGNVKINLLNWSVDDIDGGSKPFSFNEEFILEADKYFVLERAESKIALNNTGDSVRILNCENKLIDSMSYEKAVSGEAYARGRNDKWFWTTDPTPGKENAIRVSDSQISLAEAPRVLGIINTEEDNGEYEYEEAEKNNKINKISLEEIKNLEIGDKAVTRGIVAVLPGVFGAQFFYIVGSPGIQVYNYKKEFPDFKVGDYIEVSGEISEAGGERRLKTKTQADFKILEYVGAPKPKQEMCEKINESNVGELIVVSGEVVERKSATVYLDDGTEEIKIYIKDATGINASEIKAGANLAVTGILSKTSSGLRLLPRFSGDIARNDIEEEGEARVFGEISPGNEWHLAARDKKMELFKYLLAIAGFLIVALVGLLIKIRKD